MKKLSFALAAMLSSAAVFAVSDNRPAEIIVNTDQDKVAEVERHAQELRDKQNASIDMAEPTAAGHKQKAKRHHKRAPKLDENRMSTEPKINKAPETH